MQLDAAAGEVKDFVLRGPDRIVLDVDEGRRCSAGRAGGAGENVIVLDPGHGGSKDTGIVTAQGQEKAMTLEIAEAIKRHLLKKNADLAVTLTRERDQALSLDDRAGRGECSGRRCCS